jgi:adenylate cyclase
VPAVGDVQQRGPQCGRFAVPAVLAGLGKQPVGVSLDLGQAGQWSDTRGFWSLAERLPMREVAEVVGRHVGARVEVVTSQGGVLDKFAGDAALAVFGAPDRRRTLGEP